MRNLRTSACLWLYPMVSVSALAHTPPPLPFDPAIFAAELPDHVLQEQLFLNVEINGRDTGHSFLFIRRGPLFYGRASDLTGWRVNPGDAPRIMVDGEEFVAIPAISGVAGEMDEPRQTLRLTVSGAAFRNVTRQVQQQPTTPTPSIFSAFLNYDLAFEARKNVAATAFVEGGISDDWGLVANTMTLDHRSGHTKATRLDSYFLRDSPDRLTRLIVGDSITGAASWSRPARFAGIRYGTEFSLQPGFITFPTPVLTGSNAVPSEVDILVNNALQYRTQAEEGPFTIGNLPLVTGAGEVTLQIRDALGVERSVTTPYYVSRSLLRPGLSEWSVEADALRDHYGYRSFSYGEGFVAGGYRRGLGNRLTAGARAMLSEDVQVAGLEATVIAAPVGELGGAVAASDSVFGTGMRYRVYGQHVGRNWNAALSFEHSSHDFRHLEERFYQKIARYQLQAVGGVSLGAWGNIGLSYTDVTYQDRDRARILSASYSLAVADIGYLNAYALATRSRTSGEDFTAGVGFTIPFSARSSAYVQADDRNLSGELRLTPPTDRGWGYRLGASTGDIERRQAELSWRGQAGDYRLQAARANGTSAARLLASGGFVWAGGEARLARRLGDAMAYVTVPGRANIGIYEENRLVAHTDADGVALVTGLRPYTRNKLSISPQDIPLEFALGPMEVTVVPRISGAALANFDAQKSHPATVIMHMPDGSPVPAGTAISLSGLPSPNFAGYGGEVFVDDLKQDMQLLAATPSGACAVTISDPGTAILPTLGPFRCTLEES